MAAQAESGFRGTLLLIGRSVWLVVAIAYIAVMALGIGPRYRELKQTCSGECDQLLLAPEDEALLESWGLSVGHYAAFQLVLEFLMAVPLVTIALLIFLRGGTDWFALVAAMALVMFGTSFLSETDAALIRLSPGLRPPIDAMRALTYIFFLAILYLFPNGRFVPRWITWLTAIVAPLTVVLVILFPAPDTAFNEAIWATPFLPIYVTYLLGGAAAQIYRYRSISNAIERQQSKWAVFGFGGTVLVIAVYSVIFFVIRPGPGPFRVIASTAGTFVMVWLLILLPVTLGVSILRYRLWDIDIIINRTLIYGTMTAIMGGLWAVSGAFINRAAEDLFNSRSTSTAAVASTILVVGAFQPIRSRVETWINRRFYPERLDLSKEFIELSPEFWGRVEMPFLLEVIVRRTVRLMRSRYGAILLPDGDGGYRKAETFGVARGGGMPLTPSTEALLRLEKGHAALQPKGELYEILVPLYVPRLDKQQVVGLLGLGPREGERAYTRDDMVALAALGRDTGTAIYTQQLQANGL